MGKYWEYFKYVMQHKKNVFIECWKEGMYWHAFAHDNSKLRLSEFIPYAKFFKAKNRAEGKYNIRDEKDPSFLSGWLLHQKRNKHHWNYWVCVSRKNEIIPMPMPKKYIKQMICDWRAMSKKFGGTPQEYYLRMKDGFILHPETEKWTEIYLGIYQLIEIKSGNRLKGVRIPPEVALTGKSPLSSLTTDHNSKAERQGTSDKKDS